MEIFIVSKKVFFIKRISPTSSMMRRVLPDLIGIFFEKSDLDILKTVQFAACKRDFKCLDWILEYVWYRIRNFENAKRLTGPAG